MGSRTRTRSEERRRLQLHDDGSATLDYRDPDLGADEIIYVVDDRQATTSGSSFLTFAR